MNVKQNKITFCISDELQARVSKLPRSVKLSEKLRPALEQIIDEIEAQVAASEK